MPSKLLIIIPCFNEEKSIPLLLEELLAISIPHDFEMYITVINDCSTDNTLKAAAAFNNITIIDLPVNLGIGGAMQTGYQYAFRNDFDLAVQLDGDGQHPPGEINKLLTAWKHSKANIVIGSRFLVKQGFQSSPVRRLGINYLHWLNRILTGTCIFDSTSGFRLFDRKALEIAAMDYPDEYPEPESIVLFSKAGLRLQEVAVTMRKRENGQSSISKVSQWYYLFKVSIAIIFSFIRKKNFYGPHTNNRHIH